MRIEEYLTSLQSPVKKLRHAYRSYPVSVPYDKEDIQAAYLTTYMPHYYQLIYKILLEDAPDIFQTKKLVNLVFIGGGPGSEAYGVIKYIINNCKDTTHVTVNIFDINAATWNFSHNVVTKDLLASLTDGKVDVDWKSIDYDLTSLDALKKHKPTFAKADLIVIQNCINEIATIDLPSLEKCVTEIFQTSKGDGYLLIADLTCGVRPVLKQLESLLIKKFKPHFIKSTLSYSTTPTLQSVHHRPSEIISRNLLNGSDGLIPRKWIHYDYCFLSKEEEKNESADEALGFYSIYRPLDFRNLDANGYVHSKTFVGIDFGASSTLVSCATLVSDKIEVKTIPIRQRDKTNTITRAPIVPSVISFVAENGKHLLVGKHAAEYKPELQYGVNCWYGFKKDLVRLNQINFENSQLFSSSSHSIKNGSDALHLFLHYIKREIEYYVKENSLPGELAYSISIPAGFSWKEKQVLKSCLLKAGIDCTDTPFIEEPNAALINYFFEHDLRITNIEQQIVVLDFGAGTVDVSVLALKKDEEGLTSKLLSVVRLGEVGGDLIDQMMAQSIIETHGNSEFKRKENQARLIALCERLKIKICQNIQSDKYDKYKLPALAKSTERVIITSTALITRLGLPSVEFTYSDFFEIMSSYWQGEDSSTGVLDTIEKALRDANLKVGDVDKVIITGGGGRNPYIKSFIAKYFATSELVIQDNIQEQVSRGAALHSFVVNSFGKNIITPIVSHDIFVEGANKKIKLFKSGEMIPSPDVEFDIDIATKKKSLICCYSVDKSKCIYLEIPANISIRKLIFFIDPDQDLKCEIVCQNTVIQAVVANEIGNYDLFNL